MRVLIVTQYFWPENFRINDLVNELISRGHKITVLTAKPNYPAGKLFPEFKDNPERFSNFNGAEVIRVPILFRGSNKISLILNYLSYALSASSLGLWKLRKKNFDIVFVCQLSPIFLALPGVIYKKIYRKPVAMWVLDLWPDSLLSVGISENSRVYNWVGKFVSFIYNRCDLLLGQSKALCEGISQRCSDPNKIKYFPSWSESVFSNNRHANVHRLMAGDEFKVLFAGNVGEAQDFPSILSAAELIKAARQNIKIFVVGDGRALAEIKSEVQKNALSDVVIFLGRFPLEDMPDFYYSADALLVTLKQNQAFSMTIPGKVQSYMVAGKPILTMLTGEGSRIINEAKCGLTAESGDYEQLAKNVIGLSDSSRQQLAYMGANAKYYAEQQFNRDALISQLENWLEEVLMFSRNAK